MDVEEVAMLLDSIDANKTTEADFGIALEKAKSIQFEDDQKLVLYGLFKQAIIGNVNCPPPSELDTVAYTKWFISYF
jgi:acyl-CoA-binding protein